MHLHSHICFHMNYILRTYHVHTQTVTVYNIMLIFILIVLLYFYSIVILFFATYSPSVPVNFSHGGSMKEHIILSYNICFVLNIIQQSK